MTGLHTTPTASPLRVALFRTLWTCNIVSSLGTMITGVAASWLMTSLTDSAQMIALVQAAVSVPVVAFSLWAGALADNRERLGIIRWAQILTVVVTIVLTLLSFHKLLSPWLLLSLTFLSTSGLAITTSAWQASIGDIVERAQVPPAVALNSMGINVARSVGPTIGGALVAAAGPTIAFAANTICALPLLLTIGASRGVQAARTMPPERIGSAMIAGVRYVAMSRPICIVSARSAIFGILAASVPALLPLFARDILHGGAFLYGFLLGSFGIGAVLGALVSGRLRRALSAEGLYRASSTMSAAGMMVAGCFPVTFAAVPAMVLAGAGWTLTFASFNISVQMQSPRWVVGRSVAIFQAMTYAGIAGGSIIFGRIALGVGSQTALLIASGFMLLLNVLSIGWPLPPLDGGNVEPLATWQQPETALPVEARSGPVVITIEHHIRLSDAVAFQRLMMERRRIKLRDGARQWTLLRDVGDAEKWIERYQFPTWLEYLRHNHRRTEADRASEESLRAVSATWPLHIRRLIESQSRMLPGPQLGETAAPINPL